MGQHLYECENCRKTGVAHYVLERGALRLLCTKCWKDWRSATPTNHETGPLCPVCGAIWRPGHDPESCGEAA